MSSISADDPLLDDFNALLERYSLPTLAALDEATTTLLVGLFECMTERRLPLEDVRRDRRRKGRAIVVATLLEHIERTGLRIDHFGIRASSVVAGESKALRRMCQIMLAVARLVDIKRDQTIDEMVLTSSVLETTSCSTPIARPGKRHTANRPARRPQHQMKPCEHCQPSVLEQTSICACDSFLPTPRPEALRATHKQYVRQQSPARHHVRMPSSPFGRSSGHRLSVSPAGRPAQQSFHFPARPEHALRPISRVRGHEPAYPELLPHTHQAFAPRQSVLAPMRPASGLAAPSLFDWRRAPSTSDNACADLVHDLPVQRNAFDVDAYYGVRHLRSADELPESPGTAYIRQRHEDAVRQFQSSVSSNMHDRAAPAQTHARRPSTTRLSRSTHNSDQSFYIPSRARSIFV